ncbi:hypothetical protein JZO77_19025 [Enterococcus hulanensis]|uniref:hypothetical protein n=1 Tax=Enterococcus hulanensis TaxID=2559929 RepID=UPI001A8CF746|nr:hypothetical protein [Enterococcus hulanensis]MBO0458832.1 hypothetical protein [Enterococcus hulanensis]
MSAQQKRNGGWFFNKNILDEINSVPEEVIRNEEEGKVTKLPERQPSKEAEEIADLKRLIFEKEQSFMEYKKETALERQRLVKENENFKQNILRNGEEKTQNRRQIQDLEAQARRNREEIKRLKNNEEFERIKTEMDQLREENLSLKTSLGQFRTLEAELQDVQQQYNELLVKQKGEESEHLNTIQQLEKQTISLHDKEKELIQINQLIQEKETVIQHLLEEQQDQSIEGEVVSELQLQLMAIQKENEQLKNEASHSQQEIGEILISARKQANRMIEKAKLDAKRILEQSEEEIKIFQDRAKEISFEVDESRQNVLIIYEELKKCVDRLSEDAL